MPFEKGQSGNPSGRPKGSKDNRTELRELLMPHAPELIEKLVAQALEGDMAAMKLCIDRLISPYKASKDHEAEAENIPTVFMPVFGDKILTPPDNEDPFHDGIPSL